jgi:hypothetical protein
VSAQRLVEMLERVNLELPLGPGFHAELLSLARGLRGDGAGKLISRNVEHLIRRRGSRQTQDFGDSLADARVRRDRANRSQALDATDHIVVRVTTTIEEVD